MRNGVQTQRDESSYLVAQTEEAAVRGRADGKRRAVEREAVAGGLERQRIVALQDEGKPSDAGG